MMHKKLLGLFVLLGLASCSYAEQPELNTQVIDFSQQENWCIGRYTFQLPKGAKVLGTTDKYNTFDIESKTNASLKEFREAVQQVRQDYTTIGSRVLVNETAETKIGNRITKIIWGKLSNDSRGSVQTYAYVYDEKARTLFTITGGYTEEYKEKSIERIHHLVNNLQARHNNEVPTQAGVCLVNGFIADDGMKYRFSRQSTSFEYAQAPSVQVELETEAIYEDVPNVIERISKDLKASSMFATLSSKMNTLQKGEKTQSNALTPLKGYEWIIDIPLKGHHGISAVWEYVGKKDSSLDTLVQVSVETGKIKPLQPETASIAPKAGMFMHNQIINSVKKF